MTEKQKTPDPGQGARRSHNHSTNTDYSGVNAGGHTSASDPWANVYGFAPPRAPLPPAEVDRIREFFGLGRTLVSPGTEVVLDNRSLREHAIGYAQCGKAVLPLRPRSKVPACAHGKDDATTDLAQIERWWAECPDYNIGVRPDENEVVIDVDPLHGGNTALLALLGDRVLPDTLTARTGSRGKHIWLRYVGPVRGHLCEGVDLKTHSGYLVMPPSIHPNGRRYEWANSASIAHAPVWLHKHLAPEVRASMSRQSYAPRRGLGSAVGLINAVLEASEGNRNKALFWSACRAAEEGLLGVIEDDLEEAARAVGLSAREITQTIESAERNSNDK